MLLLGLEAVLKMPDHADFLSFLAVSFHASSHGVLRKQLPESVPGEGVKLSVT